MNIQTKNMMKEANKGKNWLIIAAENNTSMLYNAVKAEGWTPNNMTSGAVVEAIEKCIDFVPEEQKLITLQRILSVPVLWQNLTDTGRDLVTEMVAKSAALEDSEGTQRWGEGFTFTQGPSSPMDPPSSSGGSASTPAGGGTPSWATVLGTALPGLINTFFTKPWQTQPTQDTQPQVLRPSSWIFPIVAVVGFIVIGLIISAMVKSTA